MAAGFPSPADGYVEKYINVNEFLIDHTSSTFFITITGHSMIDVGLMPGDKVVVDRSRAAVIGNIVLAVVDREFTIKILDYGASSSGLKIFLVYRNTFALVSLMFDI